MAKLILTRGVPASGKSTWAKQWVSEAQQVGKRVRVNRDDLRHQLFGSYWGSDVDEQAVTVAQDAMVAGFLSNGVDVVLDNTNLKARDVKSNLKLARKLGAEVEFVDFEISREEAHDRNDNRIFDGGRGVPREVIDSFFNRFINRDGSFPPVPVLEEAAFEHKPYVKGKIKAVSFDIDGTLAHMTGRSPYDPTRYHEDIVDERVREVLYAFQALGYKIILLSGRSNDHRAETMAWLRKNNIRYDMLIMRPSSQPDTNDAIVKSELVDLHLSGQYDVVIHFDDRNRVVDGLRAKGMKVAQVEPGDF